MSQRAFKVEDEVSPKGNFQVLGGRGTSGRRKGRVYWIDSQIGFAEAFSLAQNTDLLVVRDAEWPAQTLARVHLRAPDLKQAPNLLVMQRLRARTRAAYDAVFDQVVDPGFVKLLPETELREVLSAMHRHDLFVGGVYLDDAESLLLYRGTLEPVLVPISWFQSRPMGPIPDPTHLAIEDHGQTIRLGEYEASADAILYEHDPEYRKRAKKRLRRQDPSLGGSIRRLRLQKELTQSDFPEIPPRTIGRIERGEVENPRQDTLDRIASRLGVAVEELDSF